MPDVQLLYLMRNIFIKAPKFKISHLCWKKVIKGQIDFSLQCNSVVKSGRNP